VKRKSEISTAEALRRFSGCLKGFRPFDDRSRAIWEKYGPGKEEKRCKETLDLESIPGMKKSIVKGMKTRVKKCRRKLDW
jgi:hypothetical protein